MQSSGRSVLVWSETSYFTSKPSSPFWSVSRPVMSGKDREATCGRIRWLTMITAHLTTFRASPPLCLPPRLTDINLTASAPAAPPSWLPHSRGPPPVTLTRPIANIYFPAIQGREATLPRLQACWGTNIPVALPTGTIQSRVPIVRQPPVSAVFSQLSANRPLCSAGPCPCHLPQTHPSGSFVPVKACPGTSPLPSCPQGPDTGPLGPLPPSPYR